MAFWESGASSAARDQQAAIAENARLQQEAYGGAATALDPWADYELSNRNLLQDELSGGFGGSGYQQMMGDVTGSEMFQELQGSQADLVNAQYGMGGLYSGNRAEALKDANTNAYMQTYGQMGNAYNNYMNTLQNWANPTATNQQSAYNIGGAQAIGQGLMGQADVAMNKANARQAMIGDMAQGGMAMGGAYLGGPAGAKMGSDLGGSLVQSNMTASDGTGTVSNIPPTIQNPNQPAYGNTGFGNWSTAL